MELIKYYIISIILLWRYINNYSNKQIEQEITYGEMEGYFITVFVG